MSSTSTPRKPQPPRITLADRLLASAGQRLRADETVSAGTFALTYAAKWQQARQGVRR
jgi:hypothetical protein